MPDEIGYTKEEALEQVIDQNNKSGLRSPGQGALMLQAVLAQHGAEAAIDNLADLMINYGLDVSDDQKVALDL